VYGLFCCVRFCVERVSACVLSVSVVFGLNAVVVFAMILSVGGFLRMFCCFDVLSVVLFVVWSKVVLRCGCCSYECCSLFLFPFAEGEVSLSGVFCECDVGICLEVERFSLLLLGEDCVILSFVLLLLVCGVLLCEM